MSAADKLELLILQQELDAKDATLLRNVAALVRVTEQLYAVFDADDGNYDAQCIALNDLEDALAKLQEQP